MSQPHQVLMRKLQSKGISTKAKTGTICGNAMVGMDNYEASIFSSRQPINEYNDKLIVDLASRLPEDRPLKVLREVINNIPNINILSIAHNDLPDLPVDLFQEQHSLEYIQMRFCNIQSLREGLFENLQNLIGVDLKSNQLKSFPKALLGVQHLKILNISNNPMIVNHQDISELSSLTSLKMFGTDTTYDEINKIKALRRIRSSDFTLEL